MNVLRWMAVPCSVITVWYGVLMIGIASIAVLERPCPPELMISGMCTASWYAPSVDALLLFYTGIVSAAVVLIPAAIAPFYRFYVALAAYGLGACFATYNVVVGVGWTLFMASAAAGSAALWIAALIWQPARRFEKMAPL